jgi:hypothetical protein
MVGTLLGSQILPVYQDDNFDPDTFFGHTAAALGITNTSEFYKSFSKVRTLTADLQRITFMQYLEEIGENFISMAFANKDWEIFLHEIKSKTPNFGRL